MYKPDSTWTWAFLLITLLQGAVIVGLEAYAFANFEQNLTDNASKDMDTPAPKSPIEGVDPPRRFVYTHTVPTFLTLYIFAVLYQIVLTIDALRLRNVIQIIGLCILNFCLMIYGAIQKVQINDALSMLVGAIKYENVGAIEPLETAVPVIIAAGTVLLSFAAWKLYQEFAWDIYKSISADLRMKRRYLMYQVYIALLKFDFFFFLGFTIQFLVVLQATTSPSGQVDIEFWLTVAALPVTIAVLLLAALFVRKESIFGTVVVMLIYLGGLGYFIFKVTRIWLPGPKRQYYIAVARPLTTFAAIDIVLLTITIVVCVMCSMNFKKGLRDHVGRSTSTRSRKNEAVEPKQYQHYQPQMQNMQNMQNMHNMQYAGAPVPSRMTIE